MLQERRPLPGPETGLLSNTGKWIVRGDTYADKARDFIGKGPWRRAGGEGAPGEQLCHWLAVLGFMVMGLVSGLSLASHSDLSPSWWCMPCSAKMGAREEDSGRWLEFGVSFWSFLNSSSCWWLISSVFLTRTACSKTTHANGSYGAWRGWAVSVSFP